MYVCCMSMHGCKGEAAAAAVAAGVRSNCGCGDGRRGDGLFIFLTETLTCHVRSVSVGMICMALTYVPANKRRTDRCHGAGVDVDHKFF